MHLMERRKIVAVFLSVIAFAGIVLFILFLGQPSEPGNRVLFGLSMPRLAIGAIFFLLLVSSLAVCFLVVARRGSWQADIEEKLDARFSSKENLYKVLTALYWVALLSGLSLLLIFLPVPEQITLFVAIIVRINTLIAWVLIASILLILLLMLLYGKVVYEAGFLSPLKIVLWILPLLLAYVVLVADYRAAAYVNSLKRFEFPLLELGAFFLAWAWISERLIHSRHKTLVDRLFLLMSIFLVTLVVYGHIAAWIDWVHKGRYAYWSLLAEQFVQGKLYLETPARASLTHDLTLYNGRWYVPNPPLPAILMMPLAFFLNAEDIHAGDFSMFFSALNSVLVFLILDEMIKRKWIGISQRSALWLVLLFSLGTNHLWVGVNGGMWFLSQILTVTFLAFATLASLKGWSPWVVGAGLALAVGARPNSVMTWPFVFAIAMQIIREQRGRVEFKQLLGWSARSAVPLGMAVAGLLFYNYARFENVLDFGYTTINGDVTIVKNAQMYGLFSPRYVLYNLNVMFLYLPQIQWDSAWLLSPPKVGMSVFLSTPPLIYLFHRYENKLWIAGAWLSVFLSLALLMFYHNTGADQFGYRYILDAIVPLIALLAFVLGKKIPWHFILLTLLSIVINIYGAAWFVNA
jgi:hypothetical protein